MGEVVPLESNSETYISFADKQATSDRFRGNLCSCWGASYLGSDVTSTIQHPSPKINSVRERGESPRCVKFTSFETEHDAMTKHDHSHRGSFHQAVGPFTCKNHSKLGMHRHILKWLGYPITPPKRMVDIGSISILSFGDWIPRVFEYLCKIN